MSIKVVAKIKKDYMKSEIFTFLSFWDELKTINI